MKRKQAMNILILTLVLAIVVTTIAYARLTAQLNITGHASVSGSWKIQFENLSDPIKIGSVGVNGVSLTNTQFSLNVELVKPKDAVTYTFDVVNAGTIDAKIVTVVYPDLDALTANNLTYLFTYADGSEIKAGDLLPGNCSAGNTADCTRHLKVSVMFNDVSNLEANSMQLSLNSSILYQQA